MDHPLLTVMRRLLSLVLLGLVALSSTLFSQARTPKSERHSRVRVTPATEAEFALLASLDADHFHANEEGGLTIVLTHADVERLRAAGVRVEVEVAELEHYYAERAERDLARMRDEGHLMSSSRVANFALGSVGGFLSPAELHEQLNRMSELYPALAATPEQIGVTHQGRPILAVRISARPASDTTVPEALLDAMHHAREPAGMMSLVYTMWSLLEGYGIDPEITYLLDNRALWFIPLVNPDGYAHNVEEQPFGGGLWRKNMRADGDSAVDLNRNYGPQEFWAHPIGGSSTNRNSETYRGPGPFSEPETQALRDFCLRHRFEVALNHHTFSNLFIQPEEILSLSTADSVYYKQATRALAALAGYAPGNSKITVGYTTRGTSEDWMFQYGRGDGEHTFSWTPESGNGSDEFWPIPSRVEPIAAWNHRMNLGIAWSAGAAPMITARTWRATDSGPVVRVTVMNVGRRTMAVEATLQLVDGAPVAVPLLAPAEELSFDLLVPAAMREPTDAPRPTIGIALSYDGAVIRDSIAPIVHPLRTIFTDDFEQGIGKWNPTLEWGIEETSDRTRVASDSPFGNYVERQGRNELILNEPISLAGYSSAELFFDAQYSVEARNHNASLTIRQDTSLVWEDVECEELQLPFNAPITQRNYLRGDVREWRRYRVNLDRFLGHDITIRFALVAITSQFHFTFDGIKLDNVTVVATDSRASSADDDPSVDAMRVTPNPFTSHLVVDLADAGRDASVELFDALGERVRAATAVDRVTIDTEGLPAGAYTVVVRRGDDVLRRRVVLAR
jgi:carboxypeptidase T